jgi:hypothetical protein
MTGDGVDRISFILGMITAFAEYVTNECKKLALSPPFRPQAYSLIYREPQEWPIPRP